MGAGLCPGCSKGPPAPGKHYCEDCRQRRSAAGKKDYQRRKRQGLCIECRKPRDREGALCETCVGIAAEKRKAKREGPRMAPRP